MDDIYNFEKLTKEIINNQIDTPSLNCINLNDISIDKIFNYSEKNPNRIKMREFYDFQEYEKFKRLITLKNAQKSKNNIFSILEKIIFYFFFIIP